MSCSLFLTLSRSFWTSLTLAFFSTACALVVGTVFTFVRAKHHYSGKWGALNKLVAGFVQLFRGIPLLELMLLMSCVFLTRIADNHIQVIITLAIAYGCTMSIVLYTYVIDDESLKQYEQALSLGFNETQAFRLVLFPQTFRKALPVLLGEISSLFKDTSVASLAGVIELTYVSRNIASSSPKGTLTPYLVAGCMYLFVCVALSFITERMKVHMEKQADVTQEEGDKNEQEMFRI
jgi:ABC-type amino acid transport system permease subunit